MDNLEKSEQQRLASAAKNALADSSFGDLATLLALRSLQAGYSSEADEALVGGLAQGFNHPLSGHSSRVRDIEFMTDGRFFVTLGGRDNNLIIWDSETGEKVKQLASFGANTFALMPDGKTALIGTDTPFLFGIYDVGIDSLEKAVRENIIFWLDLETGDIKEVIDTNDQFNSWAVAIAPEGDSFLIAFGHHVEIRDQNTEATIQEFDGHQNIVTTAVYMPEGDKVVTGSADQTVRLWDIQTGEELQRFTGHSGPVMSVAVSEDGRFIASSSLDGTVRLIDLSTNSETFLLENGPALEDIDRFTRQSIPFAPLEVIGVDNYPSMGVVFSADGTHLFSSGADNIIRQWEVNSGQLLQMRSAIGGDVLAINPDNTHLVSSNVQDIYLTQIDSVSRSHIFYGHLEPVVDVVLSADNQTIVSLSHDRTARSWDMNTGLMKTKNFLPWYYNHSATEATAWGERGKDLMRITFSPDDTTLLIMLETGYVFPWNTEADDLYSSIPGSNPYSSIGASGASANGEFTLIPGGVHTWGVLINTQTGLSVQEFLYSEEIKGSDNIDLENSYGSAVKHDAAITNDGQTVAVTFHLDNHLQLWDVESGEMVRELVGHTDWINEYAFSPDSQWLISASKDGTARIWDVATGEELHRFTMPVGAVTAFELSPNGRFLATGGDDNKARLWDIETGEQVRVFAGHEGTVNAIAFTSDGQQILTASDDTTMRLWRVNLDELIALACAQLPRDLTTEERQLYGIPDDEPTCR